MQSLEECKNVCKEIDTEAARAGTKLQRLCSIIDRTNVQEFNKVRVNELFVFYMR